MMVRGAATVMEQAKRAASPQREGAALFCFGFFAAHGVLNITQLFLIHRTDMDKKVSLLRMKEVETLSRREQYMKSPP